ncbi:alpha/beta fold hydrolase [Chitinophaga nivalis]|uniref:Alpha/beta hydrolase n=1 Tax=Chitinophaga nivalis TaxID=2991709 RepID=A0ABT3ISI4_9BACT|nr:alpha/beta hydrolase [Chitinophaga nivalis]MCW3463449.1 alpha/beta hydrolase [Chitinophaga nivalis]MCW3486861.1 alpha/beta hydrolase [Chitinophaga nivalis]
MHTPKKTGYAPVNGLKMYYEIQGEGRPIVLIHGSYMTIDMNYGALIPELAKTHQVIALEMQGHGRTADIDRPFSFPALADDVAALLQYLKVDSADVLGYSLGATVALQLTLRHPALVRKLVFISSAYKYDGWSKEAREIFAKMDPAFLESTPLKTAYDQLAPDKSHWKTFVTKMIKFDEQPYDLGAANIKAIKSPVLMISGDNDGVDLHHITDMYRLLGGGVFGDMAGLPASRLAIIPGASHVSLMMETHKLLAIIQPFLVTAAGH